MSDPLTIIRKGKPKGMMVPYVETRGEVMVYSQISHDEFTSLYDLKDDANKEIMERARIINDLEKRIEEMGLWIVEEKKEDLFRKRIHKTDELKKHLRETVQHIIELLEYSEIDKEVAHVWANAEDGMFKAKQFLATLTNSTQETT